LNDEKVSRRIEKKTIKFIERERELPVKISYSAASARKHTRALKNDRVFLLPKDLQIGRVSPGAAVC